MSMSHTISHNKFLITIVVISTLVSDCFTLFNFQTFSLFSCIKMSENYRSSLYSIFIFILAFSIINFYIKVAKEERKVRIERQKAMQQVEQPKLTDLENIDQLQQSYEKSCSRLEGSFFPYKNSAQKCDKFQELQ